MCLKKRLGVYLKKSIIVVFTFAVACSLGFCSVSALEEGEQQYLLQDGYVYTFLAVDPWGDPMYVQPLWESNAFNNSISYENFFYSTVDYFQSLSISVESGALFTVSPGQTVKISTLVTDFETDNFTDLVFELVYSINGKETSVFKEFSGTVMETEAYFVVENKTSSSLEIISFGMSWSKENPTGPFDVYLGSNFGFRNPTVYMYTESDKVLGGLNSTFGEDYPPPDDSAADDYTNTESALLGGVTGDLDGITQNWNDIGGVLGEYQGAMYGIGEFFGKLSSIPIFKIILLFSISIGVFGLLLGVNGLSSALGKFDLSGSRYDGWDERWLR